VCGIGALAGCADTSTETPTGGKSAGGTPTEGTSTDETPTEESTAEPVSEWRKTYGTSDGNDALFATADGVDGATPSPVGPHPRPAARSSTNGS